MIQLSIRKQRQKLIKVLALKYGLSCWYCGLDIKYRIKHVDHIIPRSKGAVSELDTYALCCDFCNHAKWTYDLDEYLAWLNHVRKSLPFDV